MTPRPCNFSANPVRLPVTFICTCGFSILFLLPPRSITYLNLASNDLAAEFIAKCRMYDESKVVQTAAESAMIENSPSMAVLLRLNDDVHFCLTEYAT